MSAFRHLGGDILWGSHPLDQADVDYLAGVYRDEVFAAHRAGDEPSVKAAQLLLNSLYAAIVGQKNWQRVAGATR